MKQTLVKPAVEHLLTAIDAGKTEYFHPSSDPDSETVLGIAIAKFFGLSGNAILKTCMTALGYSGLYSAAAQVRQILDDIQK